MDSGRNNRPIYEMEYSPSVAGKRCRAEEFQTRVTILLLTMMMFFILLLIISC